MILYTEQKYSEAPLKRSFKRSAFLFMFLIKATRPVGKIKPPKREKFHRLPTFPPDFPCKAVQRLKTMPQC